MTAQAPKTLDDALLAFQADPPVLTKNKAGHQSKYADLVQVNSQVLSRLNALGVTFSSSPTMTDDGKFVLEYELRHVASGTTRGGRYPLKLSDNPQHMGSAQTYARRYVLQALTQVAAEDEDDDGQAASGRAVAQRAAPRQRSAIKPAERTAQRAAAPPLPSDGPEPYTAAQRAKLMAGFGQVGIDDRAERLDICSRIVGRDLQSANDLTKPEAARVIDALEKSAATDNPLLALAETTAPDAEPEG
jgi:hypothetical protein